MLAVASVGALADGLPGRLRRTMKHVTFPMCLGHDSPRKSRGASVPVSPPGIARTRRPAVRKHRPHENTPIRPHPHHRYRPLFSEGDPATDLAIADALAAHGSFVATGFTGAEGFNERIAELLAFFTMEEADKLVCATSKHVPQNPNIYRGYYPLPKKPSWDPQRDIRYRPRTRDDIARSARSRIIPRGQRLAPGRAGTRLARQAAGDARLPAAISHFC